MYRSKCSDHEKCISQTINMFGCLFCQRNAFIRVCASCRKVFFGSNRECPKCGFAHYGALWAIGLVATANGLITGKCVD